MGDTEHSQHKISIAIVAAFVLFLFLLLCFYSCLGLTFFSSLVLAYLIAYIILVLLYPIQEITGQENEIALVIYALITFFLVILLFIYVLYMTLTDCRKDCKGDYRFRICRNGQCEGGACELPKKT